AQHEWDGSLRQKLKNNKKEKNYFLSLSHVQKPRSPLSLFFSPLIGSCKEGSARVGRRGRAEACVCSFYAQ
ncbi:hypothetical protein PJO47_29430, partial [Mycobacterium kansasii]